MQTISPPVMDDLEEANLPRGPITRFLAWVGGVDLGERTGTAVGRALAGSILLVMVALLATASGFVFASDLLHLEAQFAAVFGVFWGAMIFFLDRYIVISLDNVHGTRKFMTGAVRLTLAALIGWVIAEPLVLRAFETEVQANMNSYANAQKREEDRNIASDATYGDAPIAAAQAKVDQLRGKASGSVPIDVSQNAEVQRLQEQYNTVESARKEQQRKVECESDGSCGTGRRGDGPEWQRKLAELQRLEQEARDLNAQLNTAIANAQAAAATANSTAASDAGQQLPEAEKTLKDLTDRRREAEAKSAAVIASQSGLGAKMDALDRLREARPAINREYFLLTFVLIALDVSAVLLKLLQGRSTDERIRDEHEAGRVERARLRREHEKQELEVELTQDARLREELRQTEQMYQEREVQNFTARSGTQSGDGPSPIVEHLSDHTNRVVSARMDDRDWRQGA